MIESRPGRVLYNVEVTLRMVDQLLTELGGVPVPIPAGSGSRSVSDRVTYALMLVESLGTDRSADGLYGHTSSHGHTLRERLRRELRTLLRNLHQQAHSGESDPRGTAASYAGASASGSEFCPGTHQRG